MLKTIKFAFKNTIEFAESWCALLGFGVWHDVNIVGKIVLIPFMIINVTFIFLISVPTFFINLLFKVK